MVFLSFGGIKNKGKDKKFGEKRQKRKKKKH